MGLYPKIFGETYSPPRPKPANHGLSAIGYRPLSMFHPSHFSHPSHPVSRLNPPALLLPLRLDRGEGRGEVSISTPASAPPKKSLTFSLGWDRICPTHPGKFHPNEKIE